MFIYLVTTTDGHTVRVITDGDPTDHPALTNRVESVITIGQVGQRHLASV